MFFPCSHGYVSKVSPDGSKTLVGTYLGGGLEDSISAIAVDPAGNIYVAGITSSSDFPVTPDAYQKTPGPNFVSVLSPDGKQLLHSTFVNFGYAPYNISAIGIDQQGRVLVAGGASPRDFPASFPSGSISTEVYPFLVAFSPQLSVIDYAVAIDPIGAGYLNAMVVDAASHVYVAGASATNNVSKMFLTKLDDSGSKLWTFPFGGSQPDTPRTLWIDAAGEAYVTGIAASPDFPVTPNAYRAPPVEPLSSSQTFAVKVSADGSQSLYSALLPDISPMAAAVNGEGALMLVGQFSPYFTNFPSTPNSSQPCLSAAQTQSGAPVFFELSADGSRPIYATVLPASQPLIGLEPNGDLLIGSDTQPFAIFDTNARPAQGVTCIANAATYRSGAIAPGEIVSLFGSSIGPELPEDSHLANGVVNSSLAGVQVQFNGISAPLLYVSENQINAIVPFAIAGMAQATLQVVNQGTKLPAIAVPVAPAAPGIFTLDDSGAGQAAAINLDGSVNSTLHPAAPGSTIAVFLTGGGQMAPPVEDGGLGTGKSKPVLPISGLLDGQPLVASYVRDVPGVVEGLIQVNCVIPTTLRESGTARTLSISFGSPGQNVAAQALVYVIVQ